MLNKLARWLREVSLIRFCSSNSSNLSHLKNKVRNWIIICFLFKCFFSVNIYNSKFFQVNVSSPQLFPLVMNWAVSLRGQTYVALWIVQNVGCIGQRTTAHFILVDLLFLLVLRTHHFQALAVHLRLGIVVVAEHGGAFDVGLEVGAERGLTFNLIRYK